MEIKLEKKATFIENESVVIYDLRTKLSHKGKILEVLGSNTYLADYGKGPQHISGDVISKCNVSKRQIGINKDIVEPNSQLIDNINDEDMVVDQDEIISNCTDSTSDSNTTNMYGRLPIVYAPRQQVRRYRREQDTLGPVINQRLRNR